MGLFTHTRSPCDYYRPLTEHLWEVVSQRDHLVTTTDLIEAAVTLTNPPVQPWEVVPLPTPIQAGEESLLSQPKQPIDFLLNFIYLFLIVLRGRGGREISFLMFFPKDFLDSILIHH
jgi:hypothetical protein